MARQHLQNLPTPGSYPDGSQASTRFLVDRHGRFRPLVNPPLSSLPGVQDLPTHHSLARPLPPFTQRPWHHRQCRLFWAPTSHTAREQVHSTFCRPFQSPPSRCVRCLGREFYSRRNGQHLAQRLHLSLGIPGDTLLRQWRGGDTIEVEKV